MKQEGGLGSGDDRFDAAAYTSVWERFESIAARYSDSVAVTTVGRTVRYAELKHMAEAIANAIPYSDHKTDAPIGILLGQRVSTYAAMLGAIKAGRPYVPLDPSDPPERMRFILEDSRAEDVITDQRWAPALDDAEVSIGIIDVDLLDPTAIPIARPPIGRDHPAAIYYTSGSTGRPKGVVHDQDSFLGFVRLLANLYQLEPEDRVSLIFPHAFAASFVGIFGSLLNGASLRAFPINDLGLSQLTTWMDTEAVTVFHLAPVLFRALADHMGTSQTLDRVRLVVLGSEPLSPRDVTIFRRHFRDDSLLCHQFAGTEFGVAAAHFISPTDPPVASIAPIGKALDGVAITLIDDQDSEAPHGEPGTVVVESPAVAAGYWQNPELTAKLFRAGRDGLRVFRTGDMARHRPDGNLEHLRRRDMRVKVSGFTVEPHEIESALLDLSYVREAAVVNASAQPSNARLVAFLASSGGAEPDEQAVRVDLRTSLPHYMMPSRVTWLEDLPRTSRGKVDRAALLSRATELDRTVAFEDVATSGSIEERLSRLWQATLGVLPDPTDDFFEVGGTSIQALQLVSEIDRVFQIELAPTVLVRSSTIRDLAQTIEGRRIGEDSCVVAIRESGSSPPLYCIHERDGSALFARRLAHHLPPSRPVFAVDSVSLNGRGPDRRIEDMAERYLKDIRATQPAGPYHIVGFSLGGLIGCEIARKLAEQGEEVGSLILLDSFLPTGWNDTKERKAAMRRLEPTTRTLLKNVVSRMSELRARGKIRYFGELIANRVPARWLVAFGDYLIDKGRPIPPSMRPAFRTAVHRRASAAYAPAPYPGRLTVIASLGHGEDRNREWTPLAPKGLDLIEFDTDHQNMVLEPAVARLAKLVEERANRSPTPGSDGLDGSSGSS